MSVGKQYTQQVPQNQCWGAIRGKHQPFSLFSKQTALSINTASIAYVWDLLIADTTTGSFQWIIIFSSWLFGLQPSDVYKHHTINKNTELEIHPKLEFKYYYCKKKKYIYKPVTRSSKINYTYIPIMYQQNMFCGKSNASWITIFNCYVDKMLILRLL